MVYLLHLDTPLHHAKHYIGWSYNAATLRERIANHERGRGARFTQVCCERGITFRLARVWKGNHADRNFERRLKNRHSGVRLCPICKGESK